MRQRRSRRQTGSQPGQTGSQSEDQESHWKRNLLIGVLGWEAIGLLPYVPDGPVKGILFNGWGIWGRPETVATAPMDAATKEIADMTGAAETELQAARAATTIGDKLGHYDAAAGKYKSIHERYGDSTEGAGLAGQAGTMLESAKAAKTGGKDAEAQNRFKSTVDLARELERSYPDSAQVARAMRAEAAVGLGKPELAADVFTSYLRAEPQDQSNIEDLMKARASAIEQLTGGDPTSPFMTTVQTAEKALADGIRTGDSRLYEDAANIYSGIADNSSLSETERGLAAYLAGDSARRAGNVAEALGRVDEAERLRNASHTAYSRVKSEFGGSPFVQEAELGRAGVLQQLGKEDDARDVYREVLRTSSSTDDERSRATDALRGIVSPPAPSTAPGTPGAGTAGRTRPPTASDPGSASGTSQIPLAPKTRGPAARTPAPSATRTEPYVDAEGTYTYDVGTVNLTQDADGRVSGTFQSSEKSGGKPRYEGDMEGHVEGNTLKMTYRQTKGGDRGGDIEWRFNRDGTIDATFRESGRSPYEYSPQREGGPANWLKTEAEVHGARVSASYQRAEEKLAAGDYDGAITIYRQVAGDTQLSDDQRAGGNYQLGSAYVAKAEKLDDSAASSVGPVKAGHERDALEARNHAIAAFRNVPQTSDWACEARLATGDTLAELGRTDEAQQAYAQVLTAPQPSAEARESAVDRMLPDTPTKGQLMAVVSGAEEVLDDAAGAKNAGLIVENVAKPYAQTAADTTSGFTPIEKSTAAFLAGYARETAASVAAGPAEADQLIKGARDAYRSVVDQTPSVPLVNQARIRVGHIFTQLGEKDDAESAFQAVITSGTASGDEKEAASAGLRALNQ
ncbi:MAG: hypothetical protein GF416_02485 [Candidatus Altiarchaeales archaeon]|nr:hypothetical protein [Candidatus Altiarchaeales archaeon]MBD3415987.1 hypothetical protein [Candidatus Altiarchaeales archaeon]